MSILFATTHPDRVSSLILYGTYARRVRDVDYPWAPTLEEIRGFIDRTHQDWGGPTGAEIWAPSLAHDEQFPGGGRSTCAWARVRRQLVASSK